MPFQNALKTIALGLFALTLQAHAQGDDKYPSRPVTVIVPLSAGTTTDALARMFAERVGQRLGQTVLVDNKPGAGGTVAARVAAKAAPDGYTLLLVNSQHAINPAAYDKLPYDTLRDFDGIALVGDAPSIIAVPPQLGVRNLAEFIALAKSRPGRLSYASSGVGSQTHLSGAYFASRAGISLLHVPYRSAADVLSDVTTNRVQSVFAPASYLLGMIQSGKLVPLAVTGRERLAALPEVPTVSEAALPGFEFSTWFGFLTPAKTPASVQGALAQALQAVADDPAVRKKFAEQGITTRTLLLKDFDAYIKTDIGRMAPLVKLSGVKETTVR
jgi:tripartite-type tricarboxylate transporter receptor subunit TctC